MVNTNEPVEQTLKIYPNPALDLITVVGEPNTKFDIINLIGEKVDGFSIYHSETQIEVTHLPKGVYYIKALNSHIKKKFVKL